VKDYRLRSIFPALRPSLVLKLKPCCLERRPNQTISKILIFPVEFAATKVDDWPRQQTEEINCAASSISWPESGSVLLNLKDSTGIGKAL